MTRTRSELGQPEVQRIDSGLQPGSAAFDFKAAGFDSSPPFDDGMPRCYPTTDPQQERPPMTRPTTQAISPFFIVSNVDQTVTFYRDKLGFETRFQEPDQNPSFAIVGRDGAQLFVKSDTD